MTKTTLEDLPQESSEGLEPEQSNVPHTEEDLTPYLETIRQIEAQMRRQGIVLPHRPAVQLNDPEPKLIPNPYPDPKDMLAVLRFAENPRGRKSCRNQRSGAIRRQKIEPSSAAA